MSHTVEINASEHAVSSVTVYQQRAEVVRNFVLELEAGQSEVQITKLPTCIDDPSLRVDGVGNAVIFDVVQERVSADLNAAKPTSEKVQALEVQEATLRRELVVLRTQSRTLDDFSKTLSAQYINPAQFLEFLDSMSDRREALLAKLAQLEKKLKEVEKEIARERKGQASSDEAGMLATKVTVIVLAEKQGRAELTVTYVVSNADWKPLYDLRAKVEPSSKGVTPVSLIYRAAITQKTGEDWKDAALILSTASPITGAQIPSLSSCRISTQSVSQSIFGPLPSGPSISQQQGTYPAMQGVPQMQQLQQLQQMRQQQQLQQMQQVQQMQQMQMQMPQQQQHLPQPGVMPIGMSLLPDATPPTGHLDRTPFMTNAVAVPQEGATSASFHIEGLSSIPSDGATHKVTIGVLDLMAKLKWIAAPKLNTSTFLQCQITNSSNYVLLSGPSNVFLDDSFVAKSTIPHVSPQDTFSCSVGVDPSVRIFYPPVSKNVRTQTTGSFFASSKLDSTVFTQRISVRNTRQSQVKLLIRDQVPVSEEQNLKVAVIEPKDLALMKAGEMVTVSPEAICYWARKDWDAPEKPDATHRSAIVDGQVEWIVTLGPGKKTELVLSWEVTAPKGEKWFTR